MLTPVPVPRLWPGATVACLASGPSLTRADVALVRAQGLPTIVVNTTYQMAPWADVLYACDAKWWAWQQGAPGFRGRSRFTLEAARWPGLQRLGKGTETGLSLDPLKLCTGSNSGYQAINLAVLLGAQRILLLGYDMAPAADGRQHWHPDHPDRVRSPYQKFRQVFPTLVEPLRAAGVEVVNCSRRTALTCFPQQDLAAALPTRQAVSA